MAASCLTTTWNYILSLIVTLTNQMRYFLIILFCAFFSIGNAKNIDNVTDSITKCICHEQYTIYFKTYLIKDSVRTQELLWQNPTIIEQKIYIYNKEKLIKTFSISNKQIHIITKDNIEMEIAQIPIIDVCLLEGNKTYLYLYGALNCNGIECPEYLSIYDLSGNKIVEYVSTEHNNRYKLFNEFVTRNKLDIENGASKISIINDLTW